jgi:hypothetical protein
MSGYRTTFRPLAGKPGDIYIYIYIYIYIDLDNDNDLGNAANNNSNNNSNNNGSKCRPIKQFGKSQGGFRP